MVQLRLQNSGYSAHVWCPVRAALCMLRQDKYHCAVSKRLVASTCGCCGGHAGMQHVTLRSLPGMAGRCLRIGSAGKTFSFTAWKVRPSIVLLEQQRLLGPLAGGIGEKEPSCCCWGSCWLHAAASTNPGRSPACCFWPPPRRCSAPPANRTHAHAPPRSGPTRLQVGWATGPAPLVQALAKAHQFLVFTVPSAFQRAVAHGLDSCQDFYTGSVGLGRAVMLHFTQGQWGWGQAVVLHFTLGQRRWGELLCST